MAPVITPGEVAKMLVDHAEWMVKSGQFTGTVEQYLGYLHYRDEEQKSAVFAELTRRNEATS